MEKGGRGGKRGRERQGRTVVHVLKWLWGKGAKTPPSS